MLQYAKTSVGKQEVSSSLDGLPDIPLTNVTKQELQWAKVRTIRKVDNRGHVYKTSLFLFLDCSV